MYQVFVEDTCQKSEKIVLRDEQKAAIRKAKEVFSKPFTKEKPYLKCLWNAKMRFGKTVCALNLAKEMNFTRTIIVTHRPTVNVNWQKDFNKTFFAADEEQYRYGTLYEEQTNPDGAVQTRQEEQSCVINNEGDFNRLENFVSNGRQHTHYIIFVSMQYLRLSSEVKKDGDDSALKKRILNTQWDLVVVDEAHEGTRTELGKKVIEKLSKPKTRVLHLSGTPFNLYDDFKDDEIYTWDYIMEQQAKQDWGKNRLFSEPNPYADLPVMKIFTYDLGMLMKDKGVVNQDSEFTFSEFFRTWTGNPRRDGGTMPAGAKGKFVHEAAVGEFLDLLCKKDETSNYPFSRDEFRNSFKHTLWLVPGVKEARALEQLLKEHEIFRYFPIVNVAGENEDDETNEKALDRVLKAIGKEPEQTATITLSCDRLTTGTTIAPWTAVFYLKGSEMTSAATYMQTIFRAQTPYHTDDGRMKAECYVFDFAPDRSLKMITETVNSTRRVRASKKGGAQITDDESEVEKVKNFLHFCPVISLDGGQMVEFDAQAIMRQLQSAVIDRIARNGFNDNALYDETYLLGVDKDELNKLGETVSKTTNMAKPPKAKDVLRLGQNGLTPKEKDILDKAKRKKREGKSLTPEELEALRQDLERKKAERKERENRIAILRGISLRIPLLIFGAKLTDEKTGMNLDNFTRLVDDASWEEFMPKGVTKAMFNQFKKCYDAVKFAEAGKRYRQWTKLADSKSIDERIKIITTIHSYFHNPDKETVLTPWRVVNMHLSSTLGGYCFFNETFDGPNMTAEGEESTVPRWVEQDEITKDIFGQVNVLTGETPVRILEINSKTGLYPLYMAYSLYRSIREAWTTACDDPEHLKEVEEDVIWDKVLENNIFVICNTPMAARITERTLCGARQVDNLHIKHIHLIAEATRNQKELVNKLNSEEFWFNKGNKEMKFNAIVGNPPYNVMATGDANGSDPIYHHFVDVGMALCERGTLIHPGRFLFRAGKTPKEWNEKMLNSNHFRISKYFANSGDVFPTVDIKGGIAMDYWDMKKNFQPIVKFVAHEWLDKVLKKVNLTKPISVTSIIYPQTKFDLKQLFLEVPDSRNNIGSGGADKRLRPNAFEKLPEVFHVQEVSGDCGIHGLIKNRRVMRYIKRTFLLDDITLEKYKVLVPKANGSGAIGEVLSTPLIGEPLIGEPLIGFTGSYIAIGSFDNRSEAENCMKYIKTKFARALLGSLKVTQDNPIETWANVPMQDFTDKSDIDWSKSISEIDQQLYSKYGLDLYEIAQIEENVRAME